MNCEFSFTGHGSGQVPSSAGVNPRVLWTSVEDHQGTFIIVIHKCVMTVLGQQDIILKASMVSFSNSVQFSKDFIFIFGKFPFLIGLADYFILHF